MWITVLQECRGQVSGFKKNSVRVRTQNTLFDIRIGGLIINGGRESFKSGILRYVFLSQNLNNLMILVS